MAQVTVELGRLLQLTDFELFDFDYQFDDLQFKAQIEEQIKDFYYDYEIGSETPDMFKRKFQARFKRLIGYYNNLHNTTLLSYNPLINSKMSEALEQLATNNATIDSTSTGHAEGSTVLDRSATKGQDNTGTTTIAEDKNTKGSDYPQQPIAGGEYLADEKDEVSNQTTTLDTHNDVTENEDSTTTDTTDNTTTTGSTSTNTQNMDYTKTIEGLTGISYQELIRMERENILRIPSMIIEELKPCFILVH